MTLTNTALFGPILAMVGLTAVVMFALFRRRIPALAKAKPSMEDLRTRAAIDRLPAPATWASENLQNLFEMPVLFYVICLGAMITGSGDSIVTLVFAWIFVGLRAGHSFVHLNGNNVLRRFRIFGLSNIALLGLIVSVTYEYLTS
jgi:hypothetical protein